MTYRVTIREVPARHLAVTRFRSGIPEMPEKIGAAFGSVAQFLSRRGVRVDGPAIARYTTRPDGFDVSAGFEVAEPIEGDGAVVPLELPAREVATVEHSGSYDLLREAYRALGLHAAAQGRALDDGAPMWEEYWSGPDTPPDAARTVVFWPLKATKGTKATPLSSDRGDAREEERQLR